MRRDPDKIVNALGALPRAMPPAYLRTSLQVMASREMAQRRIMRDFWSRLAYWHDRQRLWFNDFLHTTALPCAGGLSSAVLLFVLFVVPAYPRLISTGIDVPTILTTQVAIKDMAAFGNSSSDVVVDVRVDGQGRMIDYNVVSGSAAISNPEDRHRLENALWFSEFTPATSFGRPTLSKLRLWFRATHVDVRG